MKFVLKFASSSLVDKLEPKINNLKSCFKLSLQVFKNEFVQYYEKIIIDLPNFKDFIRLANILKCDITLDYIKHDDYNYHTLIIRDDF